MDKETEINLVRGCVAKALDELYDHDQYLFDKGLHEGCIAHKFAGYLESQSFFNGYFVDCEYNRAYSTRNGGVGTKKVTSKDGSRIDIVITKRNDIPKDDLVCFEVKKWDNTDGESGFECDRQKLKVLTGNQLAFNKIPGDLLKDNFGEPYCFNYKFGFFVVFGPTRDKVRLEVFFRDI